MVKEITWEVVGQITATIQKTYPVRREDVQKEVEGLQGGHAPMNIIGMLTRSILIQGGYLEEEAASGSLPTDDWEDEEDEEDEEEDGDIDEEE